MPPGQLRALARRIPVVAIAGRRDETELDVVAVDNAAGMRALARHLIEDHGYRRLGFLAGRPTPRRTGTAGGVPAGRSRASGLRPRPGAGRRLLRGERRGRGPHAADAPPRSGGRGLRQRPDGHRRAAPAPGVRRGHPRRHSGDRLRRHLRQPGGGPATDHRGTAVPRAGPLGCPPVRPGSRTGICPPHTEILPTQCAIRASCGCPDQGLVRQRSHPPKPEARSPRPDLPARRAPAARRAEGRTGCDQPSGCDKPTAACLAPARPGVRPWPQERQPPRYSRPC